ncbi:hypothetical protein ACIQWA_33115 [Kitasatospora sp. NPDC098652]|uniref:hypothetical protein n=1 Tax=Kitasatospora sp. NPDC098652 TaxID=3364095 RepID=UPI0038089D64
MTNGQAGGEPGTADDLVADALGLGVQATARMITDYVEVGLLAPPRYRKTTQRGSDQWLFPPEQRRLFYELCRAKQRSPLPRVPHRTMVPVVLHIWLTDDTVIPVEQARRALRTHARAAGISAEDRRRKSANQVVEQFAHPTATAAQRLRLARLLREGEQTRRPDWYAVADALAAVASPWRGEGPAEIVRGFGPPQMPLTTDQVVAMWEAHWAVTRQLRTESVSEGKLLEAREAARKDWAGYAAQRPALMRGAGHLAHIFDVPEDQEQTPRQHVNGFLAVVAHALGEMRPAFQRAAERAHARS